MKLKIKGKTYSVIECKDELRPSKDGRPWIQEFYELLDEEGEIKYMIVWSDTSYEIAESPMGVAVIEGHNFFNNSSVHL